MQTNALSLDRIESGHMLHTEPWNLQPVEMPFNVIEFSASCSLTAAIFKRLTKDGPWPMLPKARGYAWPTWPDTDDADLEHPWVFGATDYAKYCADPTITAAISGTADWTQFCKDVVLATTGMAKY